jgi:hypothetical protein
MFNLEQSINGWRQQMLAAGIKSPVPLEELEGHLREEIEQQIKSGLNAQQAFAAAVQQIGQANRLKREFKKVERTLMKKIMIILLGIFGILFGPGIILPALAKHRDLGIWNSDIVMPIVWGTLILLAGLSIAIYGIRRRKA